MRASEIFLPLAEVGPVPHGTEDIYAPLLAKWGFTPHPWGWGLHEERPILIAAHLDTVHGTRPKGVQVRGGIARGIAGMLGADDKAGVAVVLYLALAMEHPLVGYALFLGEEVGGVGSHQAARVLAPHAVISVDRRGTEEVIYGQSGGLTASPYTAEWLARALGMGHVPSDAGLWTDSAVFADGASECLNLAAGYTGAHTDYDTQDLVYLDELAQALVQVPWGDMPLVRPPGAGVETAWGW